MKKPKNINSMSKAPLSSLDPTHQKQLSLECWKKFFRLAPMEAAQIMAALF